MNLNFYFTNINFLFVHKANQQMTLILQFIEGYLQWRN